MNKLCVFKTLSALIVFICIFSACERKEHEPVSLVSDLVIVTDYEQGSYFITKLLGEVRSEFADIHITILQTKQFDVVEGSFLLNTALHSFPENSVIAGIVEPGGSSRKMVFRANSRLVFVPDNTMATRILNDYPETTCYFVENSGVLGNEQPEVLALEDFYARGICSLISGKPLSGFGSQNPSPAMFAVQNPEKQGNTMLGEILFTDNFGNCISNIPEAFIENVPLGTYMMLTSDSLQVSLQLGTTYSSVPVGENVGFVNSSKFLQLSVNYGNFSEKYNLSAGSKISITY